MSYIVAMSLHLSLTHRESLDMLAALMVMPGEGMIGTEGYRGIAALALIASAGACVPPGSGPPLGRAMHAARIRRSRRGATRTSPLCPPPPPAWEARAVTPDARTVPASAYVVQPATRCAASR